MAITEIYSALMSIVTTSARIVLLMPSIIPAVKNVIGLTGTVKVPFLN